MARRAIFVLGTAFVACACASVLGITDLPRPVDGGADGLADAGPPPGLDAPADAPSTVEASTAFCADRLASADGLSPDATVFFCDDFDETNRVALSDTNWKPGIAELTEELAHSPTRSVKMVFDAGPTGTAVATHAVTLNHQITLHARVFATTLFDGAAIKLSFLLTVSNALCTVELHPSQSNVIVYCGGGDGVVIPAGTIGTNGWTSLSLSVRRNGAYSMHVAVTIGEGAKAATNTRDVFFSDDGGNGMLGTGGWFGLGFDNAPTTGTAYFDDVWVESN